ncbi:MAG: rhodanese-like domain-containing protein [Bacteroidetes bacterium]|nr:rhodanese-like domain-containing protein [Bacteroidota bacterium]
MNSALLTRLRLLVVFATLGVAVASCSDGAAQSYKTYTPAEVTTFLKQDTTAVVLDVRTPEEYASETGHLKNAKLIPVQQLEDRIGELASVKNKTVVAYCRSGHRSKQASEILSKKGFKIINMDGGITAWNAAGLPTEQGAAK